MARGAPFSGYSSFGNSAQEAQASLDWKDNLLTRPAQVQGLIARTRTIAVLGIKTERQADQPAFYVPEYLDRAGFDVIPVPVYFPEVTQILGRPVYRRLVDVPVEVDLVD